MARSNLRRGQDAGDDDPAGSEKQPGEQRSWASFSVHPPRISDEERLGRQANRRLLDLLPGKKLGKRRRNRPPAAGLRGAVPRPTTEEQLIQGARILSNLLAVISIALVFGGALGLLIKWIAGQW